RGLRGEQAALDRASHSFYTPRPTPFGLDLENTYSKAESVGNARPPSLFGGSSKGRTPDSGSGYLGSNPSPPAHSIRPHRLVVRTPASHAGNRSSNLRGVTRIENVKKGRHDVSALFYVKT